MDSSLVVHIGAGKHSELHKPRYKRLLRAALRLPFDQATSLIESSALTNTGFGSCLNSDGLASSDCTLVETSNGKVTDVLSLINICEDCPTSVCQLVMNELRVLYGKKQWGQYGLLKPLMLDYGAYKDKNSQTNLELRASRRMYDQFQLVLKNNESIVHKGMEGTANSTKEGHVESDDDKQGVEVEKPIRSKRARLDALDIPVQDTVGFIDIASEITIATSSGGNFFRLPGRVSCAGVFGTGVGFASAGDVQVSCMCSGNGDDIVRMSLGSYLSDAIACKLHESEECVDEGELVAHLLEKRAQTFSLAGVDGDLRSMVYVGVIVVIVEGTKSRLVFCHTTETFYFGFRLKGGTEVVLSRNSRPGRFLHGEYKL